MRSLIFFLLASLAVSCSQGDRLKRKLEQMRSEPVQLCLDSMGRWTPDSLEGAFNADSPMKLVVYSDTSDCSLCYITHLDLWNDFMPLEKQYGGRFSLVFMMEARPGEMPSLRENVMLSGLHHPIYLDSTFVFRRHNPQIPGESFFHCFLMHGDSILLVGNPLKNEKVEKLMNEVLEERLGKVSPADSIADSLNAQLN